MPSPAYLTGGTVRDIILGRRIRDIDLTVPKGAIYLAKEVADLMGGAFVLLDDREGVARVVKGELILDFSDFREGTRNIEEDLKRRDFTINALAVLIEEALREKGSLIDPTHGLSDLQQKLIRATSEEVFKKDPLRILRAYRLSAELLFRVSPETRSLISQHKAELKRVAPERIISELNLIFETWRAAAAIRSMRKEGSFEILFPELEDGVGVIQPGFHHLDVLEHSLETLAMMEKLLMVPERYFGRPHPSFVRLESRSRRLLKLAALFHDVGKPQTLAYKDGRPTFYNHDLVGSEIFILWARRWRLSLKEAEKVAILIRLHMRPFHLLREFKNKTLTPRAKRRLLKDTGQAYPDLFLLAMADTLASNGEAKPPDAEEALAALFWEIDRFYHQQVEPVIKRPRLLTGDDLIRELGLTPGPIFRRLLEAVEEAAILGEVKDRTQALLLVKSLLEQEKEG
ncbi:CCA tRNA nucleotidyltransferase [Thermosulfuriphilus sp.]